MTTAQSASSPDHRMVKKPSSTGRTSTFAVVKDEIACRAAPAHEVSRTYAYISARRERCALYFVFEPEQTLEVKRLLPAWIAGLRNAGIEVHRVSFSDLLWDLVEDSGLWDEWLELEASATQAELNQEIHQVLTNGNALIERVAAIVGLSRPNAAVFLTETELLHPFFRVRALEGALHDRVKTPTVVFYPGRRAGQFGLRFLGLYPEDSNYRATLIGGLP